MMERGAHGDCSRFSGRSGLEENIKRSVKVCEQMLVINSQHDHLTLSKQLFVCFLMYIFPLEVPVAKTCEGSWGKFTESSGR